MTIYYRDVSDATKLCLASDLIFASRDLMERAAAILEKVEDKGIRIGEPDRLVRNHKEALGSLGYYIGTQAIRIDDDIPPARSATYRVCRIQSILEEVAVDHAINCNNEAWADGGKGLDLSDLNTSRRRLMCSVEALALDAGVAE